jgi:malate dehydrogenase (quinone)
MVDLLQRCFPEEYPAWEPRLRELIPSLGTTLSDDPALAAASLAATAATLHLTNP